MTKDNQREIKFRAWNKKGKRWIYHGTIETVNGNLYEYFDVDRSVFVKVGNPHHFEVVEYTGLKDKNGEEIYEEDVVKLRWRDNSISKPKWEEGNGEVKVDEKFGTWLIGDYSLLGQEEDDDIMESTIEIIGNVWENPKLLKDKK